MNTPAREKTLTGRDHSPGRTAVRGWMSRPAVAVTPDTDFTMVLTTITASRQGILPVVTGDEMPIGVIAASDLLAGYIGTDGPARLTARDLMTAPAVTVTEQQSVLDALNTAHTHAIHHLPVVDEAGRLSGLLSPHELLDALRADDEWLRDEALAAALAPGPGSVPDDLRVRCERGHIILSGHPRSREEAATICLRVAAVDGLAGLVDLLQWDGDGGSG